MTYALRSSSFRFAPRNEPESSRVGDGPRDPGASFAMTKTFAPKKLDKIALKRLKSFSRVTLCAALSGSSPPHAGVRKPLELGAALRRDRRQPVGVA
jgi:hypothetical protein